MLRGTVPVAAIYNADLPYRKSHSISASCLSPTSVVRTSSRPRPLGSRLGVDTGCLFASYIFLYKAEMFDAEPWRRYA